MKKLTLIIAIVFSGMLVNAQTIQQAAYKNLGHTQTGERMVRLKTDYGTLPAKVKANNNNISKEVIFKVSNDHPMYDSIMHYKGQAIVRVGTIWTDFIYHYETVKTKKFDTLREAVQYANEFTTKSVNLYQNIQILQHKKKGYYIVGVFVQQKEFQSSDPVYFDYNYKSIGKVNKYNII